MSEIQLFALLEKNKGIIKNIKIGFGKNGRGIFVVDSSKKFQITLPENLLIDSSKLILNEKFKLELNPDTKIDNSSREFLDYYFLNYGFNKHHKNEIKNFFTNMNNLSIQLKNYLLFYFEKFIFKSNLTNNDFLKIYLNSRQILIKKKSHFMPLIELINHSHNGINYSISNNLSVSGIFDNEVFANYNDTIDSFDFFKFYHFFSEQNIAFSCKLEINFRNQKILIERNYNEYTTINNIRFPLSGVIKNTIFFTYIDITNSIENYEYKKILTDKLVSYGMAKSDVNDFYTGLINYNISMLNNISLECKKNNSPLALEILKVAERQIAVIKKDKL